MESKILDLPLCAILVLGFLASLTSCSENDAVDDIRNKDSINKGLNETSEPQTSRIFEKLLEKAKELDKKVIPSSFERNDRCYYIKTKDEAVLYIMIGEEDYVRFYRSPSLGLGLYGKPWEEGEPKAIDLKVEK